jgi:hypothetical protein
MLWHARRLACGNNVLHTLVMFVGVARMAESNEVHFGIVATLTSRPLMVYLQVLLAATILASPIISPQHLLAELLVGIRCQLDSRFFRRSMLHDALVLTCSKNDWRS